MAPLKVCDMHVHCSACKKKYRVGSPKREHFGLSVHLYVIAISRGCEILT